MSISNIFSLYLFSHRLKFFSWSRLQLYLAPWICSTLVFPDHIRILCELFFPSPPCQLTYWGVVITTHKFLQFFLVLRLYVPTVVFPNDRNSFFVHKISWLFLAEQNFANWTFFLWPLSFHKEKSDLSSFQYSLSVKS